jgi:hypothetical protein
MPPLEAVVTGVGGAVAGPAEAMILLLGAVAAEDIVASAAFRFRVIGGMMPAYMCRLERCPSAARHCDEGLQTAGEQYDSTGESLADAAPGGTRCCLRRGAREGVERMLGLEAWSEGFLAGCKWEGQRSVEGKEP